MKEGSGYLNRYNPEKFSQEIIRKVFNEVLEEGDEIMKRVSFIEEMAREEGLEKGLEKGREEGLEKGREEERKQLALKMLEEGESMAKICKYSKLTKKEIEALKTAKKAA